MRLKGSYTVEASIIITFSLIIFGMTALLAFELFKQAVDYVGQEPLNFDAVSVFRLKESILSFGN